MKNKDIFYILKDYPFCFGYGVYLLLNPNSIDDIKKASECFEISAHEALTNKKFVKRLLKDNVIFQNLENLSLSKLMKSILRSALDEDNIKYAVARSLINLSTFLIEEIKKNNNKEYND